MNEALTYEVLKQAQSEARARGWKLSNCFMLPAALRAKCEAGVLSLRREDKALLLLEDAGSFYRCCYYLSPTEFPGPVKLDREAVVEFPFAGELSEPQRLQIRALEAMGFVLGRESGMMNCAPDDLIPHPLPEAETIRMARPGELPEVLSLLEETFDPRYAFLPTAEELRQAAEEERVLVSLRDGSVAAALHAGFEKTVASVRQVAVAKSCRGRGLGKLILEAYHRRFAGQATMFQHWVDLHNATALRLYQSFGYGFSLRKANEYILTEPRINKSEMENTL